MSLQTGGDWRVTGEQNPWQRPNTRSPVMTGTKIRYEQVGAKGIRILDSLETTVPDGTPVGDYMVEMGYQLSADGVYYPGLLFAERRVKDAYLAMLHRPADPGGLTYWRGQLLENGWDDFVLRQRIREGGIASGELTE